jgi:hypothetical protein
MRHKQFRIGECAVGGIIDVAINETEITIKCLDWDTKDLVIRSKSFDANGMDADYSIIEYLNDCTSFFYAEEVFNWIKEHVTFKQDW